MSNVEFKQLFGDIAKTNGFFRNFGGWFIEREECTAVLWLQKSNYGNYYQLNIKIYVQGLFGKTYPASKQLVSKDIGHIIGGEPASFKPVFDLEVGLSSDERRQKLIELFQNFVVPFCDGILSRQNIKASYAAGKIFLTPAVKEELSIE